MTKHKKNHGFTIIELAIAIAIVGIIGAIIISSVGGAVIDMRAEAEGQAKTWAHDIGLDIKGVTCASRDTDGDSYVSCTVLTTEGKVLPLECAGRLTFNNGCRTPKLNVRNTRN